MVVQNVPRLPRKSSLADLYGGTESTMPATQIEPEVPKVPRSSATSVLLRRQASADLYGGTESTTPATQIESEVPKVPRLPRKRPWRHISPTSSPSFR